MKCWFHFLHQIYLLNLKSSKQNLDYYLLFAEKRYRCVIFTANYNFLFIHNQIIWKTPFFEFDTRNASDCLAFNKWIQFNKKESLLSFSKDLMIL